VTLDIEDNVLASAETGIADWVIDDSEPDEDETF
jgi:hypothetical protein